ncbi:MAG: hypothetical protein A3J30_04405 [Candidatus Wildermuthbacteria bacterium RIFCSPLOWO2_02_FULL_47_9c]|uniref:D-lactate dehydrogenase (cytochrome) n=2 Tax=Parcubacteria group TaxID=1794811 RepID=A0A837IL30_9BACT|nr:MAG: Oxidoreductase [Candidatus Yanofskybacteria bacterium GW2011_GWC1_48_11]KKW04467.1 MAG: Oxidoreductase [Parcubacteria group bacterium GW2011_GWB1_49_12]KKW08603.1 MAG: Oxidoreductase [Parcubacteria group bacterium GW2011_GWA1_49_26]KKW14085.1 MAG: Oxidoreductase [Parcubacteria group bacterium GW2011_GWA2_50_10]OHA61581.1 MAG: hypothetical protein A2109_03580 [Candidatus Wildermuthbacteria bacterium GWA1_49_26]OHA69733.1 MAG: hypothetical protein A3D63_00620 [Candidatus Wildermuthbacter
MILREELQKLVKGEVRDDDKTLKDYSRDYSIFELRPRAVVFPKDAQDVKKLVAFAARERARGRDVSLTARSAGTCMSGGPLSESIVVVFTKHFNKLKELKKLNSEEGYAVAQPGMYYRDFEKKTLQKGLILPSYPASREICALGGMVANSGGGENSLRYGKTEKFVQELKVMLRDGNEYTLKPLQKAEFKKKMTLKGLEGEIYRKMFAIIDKNFALLQRARPRVSKNSAGYALWDVWDREKEIFDLTKVLVGSQGTLGIITEITFRLVRPHPYSTLLVIFLKDLKPLPTIVERILECGPESFESYDDETLKLALRFLPGFIRLLKGNILSLAWQFLPEFKMFITGGMPKLVLFAEFAGDDEKETRKQAVEAEATLQDLGLDTRITRSQKEVQKYFTVRRESFKLLHEHAKNRRTVPFIDDFAVAPEYLPEFFPRLQEILKPYAKYMTYTVAGHVGDGNFHIIPLMDMREPKIKEIIPELMEKVHPLIFKYKGSFTGEHNDGLIRSPYLKDMYGAKVYKLFEETKKVFDPEGIFNPGKKVGASMRYALEHIISEN